MNKKLKILIWIIAIIASILVIAYIVIDNYNMYKKKLKSATTSSVQENTEPKTKLSDILYDEEIGEYYMIDETTGEIAHRSYNESDLYIYTIDPDYDPKNPDAVEENEY